MGHCHGRTIHRPSQRLSRKRLVHLPIGSLSLDQGGTPLALGGPGSGGAGRPHESGGLFPVEGCGERRRIIDSFLFAEPRCGFAHGHDGPRHHADLHRVRGNRRDCLSVLCQLFKVDPPGHSAPRLDKGARGCDTDTGLVDPDLGHQQRARRSLGLLCHRSRVARIGCENGGNRHGPVHRGTGCERGRFGDGKQIRGLVFSVFQVQGPVLRHRVVEIPGARVFVGHGTERL
mmetsp:Transcript_18143/g.50476  ORF Transcript_18143/g.50476 Transcript_18143/m.50476 type:complete len:231 (-) Transcript_18143:5327-6019(-)